MKITIQPDPVNINYWEEFSEIKNIFNALLKSLGVSDANNEKWLEQHEIDLEPSQCVKFKGITCFIPKILFETSDWYFWLDKGLFGNYALMINDCAFILNICTFDYKYLRETNNHALNIDASYYGGESLPSSIKCYRKTKSIDISFSSELADIGNIISLINIEYANFRGCQSLININPLANLVELKWLKLYGCNSLLNISPLAKLSQLNSLVLGGYDSLLTDICPLANLKQLTTLDLGSCKSLSNIDALANLSNLLSLNLSN